MSSSPEATAPEKAPVNTTSSQVKEELTYAKFLQEADPNIVDVEKSIFYNLSKCNSAKDKESVDKLLEIIYGDQPLESCEYINLYVVENLDGNRIGEKIIEYLENKDEKGENITELEYLHLWKQIFFQNPLDRKKYGDKKEIIKPPVCVSIQKLLKKFKDKKD